jgi:hypothetical protein
MILPMDAPMDAEQKLPFPTRPLRLGDDIVEEYIIPDDKKQEVLELLYFFENAPSLDEEMYDLHEGKTFIVRDFRVTWENGQNWLVSPYYPNSGGTVIDWVPPDDEDDGSEDEYGEDEYGQDDDGVSLLDEDDDSAIFGDEDDGKPPF